MGSRRSHLLSAGEPDKARYWYQVVREWADRAHRSKADLSLDMALRSPDPDISAFSWIAALRQQATLPHPLRRR